MQFSNLPLKNCIDPLNPDSSLQCNIQIPPTPICMSVLCSKKHTSPEYILPFHLNELHEIKWYQNLLAMLFYYSGMHLCTSPSPPVQAGIQQGCNNSRFRRGRIPMPWSLRGSKLRKTVHKKEMKNTMKKIWEPKSQWASAVMLRNRMFYIHKKICHWDNKTSTCSHFVSLC